MAIRDNKNFTICCVWPYQILSNVNNWNQIVKLVTKTVNITRTVVILRNIFSIFAPKLQICNICIADYKLKVEHYC